MAARLASAIVQYRKYVQSKLGGAPADWRNSPTLSAYLVANWSKHASKLVFRTNLTRGAVADWFRSRTLFSESSHSAEDA